MNSRLGPVSELTGAQRRFSGRAEPRLEPRLIGAVEPAQPRMSAMLKGGGSAPEESRVNSRLGPVSELTALTSAAAGRISTRPARIVRTRARHRSIRV